MHKNRENIIKQINQQQTNKLIFTTYSPYIKTKYLKKKSFETYFKTQGNTTLKTLFPTQPIIAYKRNKNKIQTRKQTTNKRCRKTNDRNARSAVDIIASLLEEQ